MMALGLGADIQVKGGLIEEVCAKYLVQKKEEREMQNHAVGVGGKSLPVTHSGTQVVCHSGDPGAA